MPGSGVSNLKSLGKGLVMHHVNTTKTEDVVKDDPFRYWAKSFVNKNQSQDTMRSIKSPMKSTSVLRSLKSIHSKESGQSGISSNVTFLQLDDSDEPYEKEFHCILTFFQASMFATALEDSLTSLRLLEECNTRMRIAKALDDMPLLLEVKYGVVPAADENELDTVDPKQLDCAEYKLYKLERDRTDCSTLLTGLYINLATSCTFNRFWRDLNAVDERDQQITVLFNEETKNKTLARTFYRQMRQSRNHYVSAEYEMDFVQDNLRKQIQDADHTSAIRGRYVDNWQQSRTEQHVETIKIKEQMHLSSIEKFKTRMEQESRVHSELEMLVSITVDETLKKVDEMMAKYDKDTEAMDLRIQIQKNEYQNMLERRKGLQSTVAQHDRDMKNWIKFKEERAAAQKYHRDMMNAATVVQAWWRGLIVRLQLGPFRPKKRLAGKPKKK